MIVLEDKAQTLVARFMYGSLDIVSLSGEKVSVTGGSRSMYVGGKGKCVTSGSLSISVGRKGESVTSA